MGHSLREWVPRWWGGEGGTAGRALSTALAPAEAAFRGIVALRNAWHDGRVGSAARASIPVVSVGNLTVGGAGKTPLSAWMAGRLAEDGRRPAVIVRGYGDDELLVHRELNPEVPVFAAIRRADGVAAAASAGCDVAVLDDGFQHRRLPRDLDVVVVSAEGWEDSPRLLPRGPWREPLTGLRRADLVIVTRKSATKDRAEAVATAVRDLASDASIGSCALLPAGLQGVNGASGARLDWLRGRRVLAVASIANPGAFLAQLRSLGADVELVAFADHHSFTPADIQDVLRSSRDRPLVMTRKEAVKLRTLLPPSYPAFFVEQRVEFEAGEDAVLQALRRAVRQ